MQGTEMRCRAGAPPEHTISTGEVVELGLLFPAAEAAALEAEARRRGLTLGEMLRRLVSDFLTRGERTASGPP